MNNSSQNSNSVHVAGHSRKIKACALLSIKVLQRSLEWPFYTGLTVNTSFILKLE